MVTIEEMEKKGLKDGSLVKLVLKKGTRCIEMNHYLIPEEEFRDKTNRQINSAGIYLDLFNKNEERIVLAQNYDSNEKAYISKGTFEGFIHYTSKYDLDTIESYKILND